MSPYFSRARSSVVQTASASATVFPPVMATRVPSGQVRRCLAVLPRAQEVAGVDGGRGERSGPARVGSVAREPEVASVDVVGVGGDVAHGFERVAPVAEVPRAIRQGLELVRLNF